MRKLFAMFVMALLVAGPVLANEATKSHSGSAAPAKSSETAKSSDSSSTSTTSTTSSSTTSTAGSTASPAAPAANSAMSATKTASSSETLPSGVKTLSGPKGEYFATASGLTIYTFSKDEKGKSTCTGACSKMWPALAATSSDKPAGPFTIINGNQWAFNGSPLYTYSLDKKPGDMNGSSIPGWSVASSSPSAPAEKPAH